MRSAILGFVAGACLLQVQAALPTQSTVWLLIVLALALGLLSRCVVQASVPASGTPPASGTQARRPALLWAFRLGCGATLGFIWAALFAQYYLATELPKEWEGRDVTVVGTIDSLPHRFEQGVRFNFAVERVVPIDGVVAPLPPKHCKRWARCNPASAGN